MNKIYFKGKLNVCNNYGNSFNNKKLSSIKKYNINNTIKNSSNKNNHTIQKNKINNFNKNKTYNNIKNNKLLTRIPALLLLIIFSIMLVNIVFADLYLNSQTGNILFNTSGTERGRIDSNGLFGIGTIAPQQKLTLGNESNFTIEMSIPTGLATVATNATSGLESATYFYKITALDGTGGETSASAEISITLNGLGTNATNVTWNAVIGATSYRVYNTSSSDGQASFFTVTDTNFTHSNQAFSGETTAPTVTTAYVIKISSVGDSWLLGGNVGINISAPTSRLHVVGNVNITGDLFIGGSIYGTLGAGNISGSLTDAQIDNDITIETTTDLLVGGGYLLGGITLIASGGDLGSGQFAKDILVDGQLISVNDIEINQSFIPTKDLFSLLGNVSNRFLDLFVINIKAGNETLVLNANVSITGNLTVDGNTFVVDDVNNRVGIGTTQPGVALQVVGDINASGSINATRLDGLIDCSNIDGGSDGDFCTDADTTVNTNDLDIVNQTQFDNITIIRVVNLTSLNTLDNYVQIGDFNLGNITNDTLRSNDNASLSLWNKSGTDIFLREITGKVGIGTGSPGEKLVVLGDILIYESSAAGQKTTLAFRESLSGAAQANISYDHSGNDLIIETSTDDILLLPAGNVGIGTTSPGEKLHVVGNINTSGRMMSHAAEPLFVWMETDGNVDENWWVNSQTGTLVFKTVNDALNSWIRDVLALEQGGNVGIGTTSPNSLLEISRAGPIPSDTDFLKLSAPSGATSATNEIRINFSLANEPTAYIGAEYGPDGAGDGELTFGTLHATNGITEKMRIDNDGNVGIGTTSPVAKLHVYGTSGANITIGGDGNNDQAQLNLFEDSDAGDETGISLHYDGTNNELNFIDFSTGTKGNALMTIERGGNVGIGTTSPGAKLSIAPISYGNSQDGGIEIKTTNGNWVWGFKARSTSGGSPYFTIEGPADASGNTFDMMTFGVGQNNGNVGIGTTNPQEKLVVIGNVNISGTLNVSGRAIFDGDVTTTNIYDDTATGPWLELASCGADTAPNSVDSAGTITCTANTAHTTNTDASTKCTTDQVLEGDNTCVTNYEAGDDLIGTIAEFQSQCADCVQASDIGDILDSSHITDIYVFTAGDTMTGSLTVGDAAGEDITIGDADCANDCDLNVMDGGICLDIDGSCAAAAGFLTIGDGTDGSMGIEIEDGSMCIGDGGCTAPTTDGNLLLEGDLDVAGGDITTATIRFGTTSTSGRFEFEDGGFCVGDGGCTASATDGTIYAEHSMYIDTDGGIPTIKSGFLIIGDGVDGAMGIEIEDGSMCIGDGGCTAPTTDGNLLLEGDLDVAGGDITTATIRFGTTSTSGRFEFEDGSVCIGDAGCTASATDGTLTVEGTINSAGIINADATGIAISSDGDIVLTGDEDIIQFASQVGNKINLFSTNYGIAIQSSEHTMFAPDGTDFRWRDAVLGNVVMELDVTTGKLIVSDGADKITFDPSASTPTISTSHTSSNKNIIITSADGSVIIQLG